MPSPTMRDSAAPLDIVTGSAPGDPYPAPAPNMPFLQAITQPPVAQRILIATASSFRGPTTDPEVVGAVEGTGLLLEHQLPIGVQLIAPDETILLQLAEQLETAAPWADQWPNR